jgi:hypothetical protein
MMKRILLALMLSGALGGAVVACNNPSATTSPTLAPAASVPAASAPEASAPEASTPAASTPAESPSSALPSAS